MTCLLTVGPPEAFTHGDQHGATHGATHGDSWHPNNVLSMLFKEFPELPSFVDMGRLPVQLLWRVVGYVAGIPVRFWMYLAASRNHDSSKHVATFLDRDGVAGRRTRAVKEWKAVVANIGMTGWSTALLTYGLYTQDWALSAVGAKGLSMKAVIQRAKYHCSHNGRSDDARIAVLSVYHAMGSVVHVFQHMDSWHHALNMSFTTEDISGALPKAWTLKSMGFKCRPTLEEEEEHLSHDDTLTSLILRLGYQLMEDGQSSTGGKLAEELLDRLTLSPDQWNVGLHYYKLLHDADLCGVAWAKLEASLTSTDGATRAAALRYVTCSDMTKLNLQVAHVPDMVVDIMMAEAAQGNTNMALLAHATVGRLASGYGTRCTGNGFGVLCALLNKLPVPLLVGTCSSTSAVAHIDCCKRSIIEELAHPMVANRYPTLRKLVNERVTKQCGAPADAAARDPPVTAASPRPVKRQRVAPTIGYDM
jgi:hypothetical protein